jgi:uncharacterized protein involved in outer membrane biogenesis
MKKHHRTLFWIGAGLLSLAVAVPLLGYLALTFYDVNRLKPRIERAVSTATGREFVIHGDLSFTPGLAPTVRAEQLTLTNPQWAKDPEFASIGALEATFELKPLLQRQLIIHSIHLSDAELHLEKGAGKDQQNWVFTPQAEAGQERAEAEKEGGFRFEPRIAEVQLENCTLHYRDGQKNALYTLGLPSVALQVSPNAKLTAELTYEGITGELTAGEAESLPVFMEQGGKVSLAIRTPAQNGALNFDGTFGPVAKGFQLEGALEAKADSLAAFRPLAPTLPETAPVALKIKGSATPERIALASYQLNMLPQGPVQGKADIRLGGARPVINADVALPAYVMEAKELAANAGGAGGGGAPATGGLIPDAPLPVDWVKALDGIFQITMPRFQRETLVLQNIQATATLRGGVLEVAPLRFAAFEGQTEGRLSIDASTTPPQFAMQAHGRDWQMDHIVPRPDNQGGRLQGGRTQLALDLAGQGESVKPLLATLRGNAEFDLQDLRYRSPAAAAALTDFFQLLRGQGSGDIRLNCAAGRFAVARGVATAQHLGMDTSGAYVTGEGDINLAEERLNLVLTPRAKAVGFADLAVPVRFAGSMLDPSVRLDTRGTALRAGQVALGIASGGTLGLAMLGKNLTDKIGITANNSPCKMAVPGNLPEAAPAAGGPAPDR